MAKTTIYHNPRCSKSRQALALLREHDIEPEIVEYLKTPPTKTQLKQLLKMLDLTPKEIMRKNEEPYKKFNIGKQDYSTNELIDMMVEYPILIERPIVIHNKKAVVARPPENCLELL